jgi:hypothetical protein
MRWVLQNYRVRTYIDNGQNHDRKLYQELMDEVNNQKENKGLRYFPHDKASAKDQDFCKTENLDTVLLFPKGGYKAAFFRRNQNNCSVMSMHTSLIAFFTSSGISTKYSLRGCWLNFKSEPFKN